MNSIHCKYCNSPNVIKFGTFQYIGYKRKACIADKDNAYPKEETPKEKT
jgi:hypothetical protein